MHADRWAVILIVLVLVVLFALPAATTPVVPATQGSANVVTGLSVGYPVSLNDQQKLFYSSGLWWVFYSDGSSMQCTTSGDGTNWALPIAINSSVVAGSKFSVWFDDVTNVLYYVATSGGSDLHYRYGALSASGCGSISWSMNNTEVAGTFGNVNTPTISAVGPSSIWISVTENTRINYYIEAFLCNSTGCSSKLVVTPPYATYESIILGMGSGQGASSKAGLLYAADTGSGGSALNFDYTTNGGSTWNSSAFTTVNTYQGNRMSAFSIGTTVYIAANEYNPNNILFFKYTLGGAESAETLLIKASGGVRNVDIASDNKSAFVVGYTNSTHVGYIDSTDLGTTWGPVQTLYGPEPTIYQSVLNTARGPDGTYGVLWSEGTTSHTIKFGTFSPVLNSTITTTTSVLPTTGTTITQNTNTSTSVGPASTSSTNATSTVTPTATQSSSSTGTSSLVYLLLTLDILSAFVAFPISYYSSKFNRFVDSTTLRMVSIGFAILGTGLLVEGITTYIADATVVEGLLAKRLVADGGLIFFALQLVAYVTFAWGYGTEVFGRTRSGGRDSVEPGAVLPVSIIASTFGVYHEVALLVYLMMVALLAFIVFEAIMIYVRGKKRSALLVLLSFGLIFAGHLLMLDSVVALTPLTFYEGTIVQFVGFVSLLWFLIRSGRLGTA